MNAHIFSSEKTLPFSTKKIMTKDAEGDDDATATTTRRVRVQERARSRFSSRRVVDRAPFFCFFFFFFFSMIVFPRLYLILGECAREENWKTSESLQSPNAFTLPLSVDVLLLGLDDTVGNDPYMRVDKAGLLSHLNEAFGTFSVFNLNEKKDNFIGGKEFVIRENKDDFTTEQDDGNAGKVIAKGSIVAIN